MQATAGKDKYGHFVMFGGFRSAMPDAKTAKQCAAAREMETVITDLLDTYAPRASQTAVSDGENSLHSAVQNARAVLRKV